MTTHEAASSALYHIEAIERRFKLLKQMINPQTGTVTDPGVMASLMVTAEDEMRDLRDDLVRLL